ncbi:MAG: SMI1/KNR4 family protein [Planctomycetaceae bacterium]|nr:SMI1/KNR4 family protein [Planctomycetaceae bacterium]
MNVKFEPSRHQASNDDILAFEKQWKIHFPMEYREFLRTSNGGFISESNYLLADGYGQTCVTNLFGIGVEEFRNLHRFLSELKDILPAGFLPIGDNESNCYFRGNLFLMNLHSETDGNGVYYFRIADAFRDGNEPNADYLHFVADSFQQFVDQIKPNTVVFDKSRYRSLTEISELIDLAWKNHWAPFDIPCFLAQCLNEQNVSENLKLVEEELGWRYVEFFLNHAYFEDFNPRRYYPKGDLFLAAKWSHINEDGSFTDVYSAGIHATRKLISERVYADYNPYAKHRLPLSSREELRRVASADE